MPEKRMPDLPRRSPASNMRGLLLLNGLLLVVLLAVTFGGSAEAQSRIRGEYTMVAGGANGSQSSVVYIVDVANQELMAITYNQNTKQLAGVGYRNLAYDATAQTGRN